MHILIIHQAFASLNEPGGTRHHEFARLLSAYGHQVTVIASPVSYITGSLTPTPLPEEEGQGVRVIRASVYSAHHKSFAHRVSCVHLVHGLVILVGDWASRTWT